MGGRFSFSGISFFILAVLLGVLACDAGKDDGSGGDPFGGGRKPPAGGGGTGWGGGGKFPGSGRGGEGGAVEPPPPSECAWNCARAEAGCDARLVVSGCEQRCEEDWEFAGCLEAFCAPEATACHPARICKAACDNTYLGCGIRLSLEGEAVTLAQCAIVCELGLVGSAQAACLADLDCGQDTFVNSWLVNECLAGGGWGGEGGGWGGDGGNGEPYCGDDWVCHSRAGSYCADLDWDNANCGECGFDCKSLSSSAICIEGECW